MSNNTPETRTRQYWRNWFNNLLKKIKEKNELKSVEVDVISNLVKDDVEIDVDFDDDDDDDDDDDEDWVIRFR